MSALRDAEYVWAGERVREGRGRRGSRDDAWGRRWVVRVGVEGWDGRLEDLRDRFLLGRCTWPVLLKMSSVVVDDLCIRKFFNGAGPVVNWGN